MKNLIKLLLLLLTLLLIGCTSIKVRPIKKENKFDKVVIIHNPKVVVSGFEDFLRVSLDSHGIKTNVVNSYDGDDATLKYVAYKSWDGYSFLRDAEIWVWKDGRMIGYAQYHLIGRGGFSLFKWQSVKTKMTPVMNELLKEYTKDYHLH